MASGRHQRHAPCFGPMHHLSHVAHSYVYLASCRYIVLRGYCALVWDPPAQDGSSAASRRCSHASEPPGGRAEQLLASGKWVMTNPLTGSAFQ